LIWCAFAYEYALQMCVFFNTVGVFSDNIYNKKNIRHKEIYIQKKLHVILMNYGFLLLNMNMNQWVERCLYQYAFNSFFFYYIVNRYPINKVIFKVTTYDLGKQLSCSFNHFYL